MRPSVLFAGDSNADIILSGLTGPLQEDREVFCGGFRAALGGSSTLCAAAYARLGGKAEFCGLVGDDEYGRLVRSELARAGVGIRMLRSSREERTGVTLCMVRDSSRTQVTYPGSLARVDESVTIRSSFRRFAHLHVSGIYGTPAFLPRLASLLRDARAAGLSTSLDTQWDPSETWSCAEDYLPGLSYLFINGDEARSLAGRLRGRNTPDYAAAWTALSELTACPIIKLGADGAYAGGRITPSRRIEVVDTTGAGDTFAAAYLYATLEERRGFEEAMALAVAAGALACTYMGGASPELSLERVKGLLD